MTDKPQPSNVASALSFVFILGIVGVIVYSCNNNTSSDTEVDDGGGGDMAEVMCEDFVTDRLKAPSTADFPGDAAVLDLGAGEYEVTAAVDSENGFGAMIRTDYVCTIRYAGGDKWHLVSLDIDE